MSLSPYRPRIHRAKAISAARCSSVLVDWRMLRRPTVQWM
ncbi:hypothetical protein SAMN04488125_10580 [Methylorubrum salsuginis]|uniref:Uncharacterized protein n=1 Tax=Methylorubrum salsuginis TaxID=414703 RepID=A0A1I4D0W6_9HYPH|nr:hypothetical protein SAMN04488125_10580 [Methylorubrum salsuginis]